MIKKLLAVTLAGILLVSLAACGGSTPAPAATAPAPEAPAPAAEAPAPAAETPAAAETPEASGLSGDTYIAVVSKGFQHQFWQVVKKGAEAAAAEYGVQITFDGPPTESDIQIQVDMLKSALDKKPAAIALAALDTEAVKEMLLNAKNSGIPVVGFDSGVPNAPEGSIYATASTNNYQAATLAAEHLFANEKFSAALAAATAEKPIRVAVLAQDATSDSIVSRSAGFVDKLAELVGADKTSVVGHDKFKKKVDGAVLEITVNVPATTSQTDMKAGADSIFALDNLVAVYGSNEAGVGGILDATDNAQAFAPGGKYENIIAIGFDAGKYQKNAVKEGWFLGSVTQDPYSIGYQAVKLCVDALNGVPAPADGIVDTGAKWYDKSNLSDPSIDELVYE